MRIWVFRYDRYKNEQIIKTKGLGEEYEDNNF